MPRSRRCGLWSRKCGPVVGEAEVPKAIAEALRQGKIGVLDYMNLLNISADTQIRKAISRLEKETGKKTEQD